MSFSLIFSPKIGFYSVGFRVCGATRRGGHALVSCAHPGAPPLVCLGSRNSYYWYKKSSQSFIPIRELLFLHKNNTMVVLLKIASARDSSIQIMQIRVQNKGKSVRKSRYDGDVSTPPSLDLCLSSSNLVEKLKVKRKNFYELFWFYLHK